MKLAAFTLAFVSFSAQADFFTGNDLYRRLSSDSPIERMVGLGYVIGVYDVGTSVNHCPPSNITTGQIFDMAHGFLRDKPVIRDKPAEMIVNVLLSAAWPCPKRGTNL